MGAVGTALSLPSPWDVARGTCCRVPKVSGHQLAPGQGRDAGGLQPLRVPAVSVAGSVSAGRGRPGSPSLSRPRLPAPLLQGLSSRRLPAGGKAGNAAPAPGQPPHDESDRKTEPHSSVSDLVNSLTSEMLMVGGWGALGLGVSTLGIQPSQLFPAPSTSAPARPRPLCQVSVGRADAARTCPPGWHEGASGAGHVRDALSGGIWLIGAPVPRDEWRRARSRRKRWGQREAGQRLMSPDSWRGWGLGDGARVPASPRHCAHPPPLSPSCSSPQAPRMTRATKASAGRTWAASSSASATTSRSPP